MEIISDFKNNINDISQCAFIINRSGNLNVANKKLIESIESDNSLYIKNQWLFKRNTFL